MAKRFVVAALILSVTALVSEAQTNARTPVLVELFTSEGCSSCPPADELLARLDHDQPIPLAQVIVLSEHVDYWDSLGWRDRFSSHLFTTRQNGYGNHFHLNDVYTPQMVVAGSSEFNGADGGAAARAIVQAARKPGLPLMLADGWVDGKHLGATLSLAGTNSPSAELYAAVVSAVESTQVKAGENGGRTLRHAGVVRALTRIGNTRDLAHGPMQIRTDVPVAGQGLRLVVFAQGAEPGPVLGVAVLALAGTSPLASGPSGK